MKRTLLTFTAILLSAVMLAGCVSVKVDSRNPAPIPAPKELTRGTIEGNVYTNELAELTFTAPEGWVFATDEEIAEMAGAGAETMGQSRSILSEETFKKVNTYDMMAAETMTGTNVAIMYQNLTAALGGTPVNEEIYYDHIKEAMKKSAPFNLEFGDYTEAKIGENTYKVMAITFTDYGLTEYYYVRRAGNYMLVVLAAIAPGSNIDSIMANFS